MLFVLWASEVGDVPTSYDPEVLGSPPAVLKDCTEAVAKRFEWEVPDTPKEVRQRAILAASHWAISNCYLPCDFVMCATIAGYSDESVTVYVSYEFEPFEPDVILIGPEATVVFRLPSFTVKESVMFHIGCRWGDSDCSLGHR